MQGPRSKYVPPFLSRSTEWSLERIAKLTAAEVRQLAANAERLGDDAIAALCAKALKEKLYAPAAASPARKPAPKRKPAAKPAPEAA